MRHEDKSHKERNLTAFLVVVLILTCSALIWSGWHTYHSYIIYKSETERQMRISELHGTILHLDEVLTMSARMAAAASDLRWEQRYRRFEPSLDAAIKEAIAFIPEAKEGEAAEKTDAANIALVKMENRAFDLIREGHTKDAKALLSSNEYEELKRIYAHGMDEFTNAISYEIKTEWKHEKRRILLHAFSVLALIPFLIVAWFVVFRTLNKWRAMIMTSNRRLALRSDELIDLNYTLINSEERINLLLDSTAEAIYGLDLNGNCTFCNSACLRMVGYDKQDDLLGMNMHELIHHTRVDGSPYPVEDCLIYKAFIKNEKSHVDTEVLFRKDGNHFPAEYWSYPINRDGETIGSVVTFLDITERKQAETSLKESEERFRAFIHNASVCIHDIDLEGRMISMNPSGLKMMNVTDESEIRGLPYLDVVSMKDRSYVAELMSKAFEGHASSFEFEAVIDGVPKYFTSNFTPIKNTVGLVKLLMGITTDITERKQAEEQLSHQASHDTLTGLVNRREFERRAERLLSTVKQDKGEHALCFMDLDQFKVVNDTCGHTAGDEMLRQLSSVLQSVVRHRDTLARLGGDEFGVLMEHCSLDDAHRVATTLLTAIQDYQFSWEGHSFKVGVSIGLVPITETTSSLTELLKDADAACYMAKDKGRNRIHVYHAEDSEIAQRHGEMQWVTRLNQALEDDRFCLYAQPIVPLDGSTDKHYELLLRMVDEKGKIIPPGAFLPAAERYNLISKIDHWVIEHAFGLLADNPAFLKQFNFCSINLSGQSLTDPEILKFIITQLDESGIGGEKICFEITETAAISNLSMAMKFISILKELGCRFALDDFGSGLSSFGYLKNLPVNYLKIDGMFVKDIVDDPIDHALVKSINEIGQVMGMKTIAEFVENDEIKGMLRLIGVNYAQGYGIGKPLAFDKLLGRSDNVTDINNPKDDEYDL